MNKNAGAEKFEGHASGFSDGDNRKLQVVGKGRSKVIPQATAPHMTLMTAMAAMCYLAVLAIGALLMTDAAVNSWTSQIASQVTVQITAADGVDVDGDAAKVADILTATKGIAGIDVVSPDAARKLLEPWLGEGGILDDLPIPRLINVSIDQSSPPDLELLRATLATEVPSATLDTHRRWQAELISMAGSLTWLAIAVLSLIATAAIVLVIYATRAAMEANREVIEVLYLAGARDSFISREVLWRFCLTGLKAGLIGSLLGFATFVVLGLGSGRLSEPVKAFLYHPLDSGSANYAAFIVVPVVATMISLITARISISRVLKAMF
ncbi:cell division protein FtsX [Anderseniella sp. Alg231-50]|uniref:cell division protein FtsX n=1 Tax=Anderseniella sp. Alg231-50 TaxID=1922226 RepID=UPI00307B9792